MWLTSASRTPPIYLREVKISTVRGGLARPLLSGSRCSPVLRVASRADDLLYSGAVRLRWLRLWRAGHDRFPFGAGLLVCA